MSNVSLAAPLPSWLVLSDDGVTVTLKHKANLNGVLTDKLMMRAPSVKDVMAAKIAGNGDHEKVELNLFCSLLTATETELTSLKYKDYMRLQAGYFRLVEEDDV